jgi:ribosomal subunit interface protein
MTIQINAGKNLSVHEEYSNELEALLTEELTRYTEHITRLEVHLSDENGNKESQDDKKCLLEARMEGRQPIAVSASGDTYDQAVDSAIDKLKASLDTIIGKLRNHHQD